MLIESVKMIVAIQTSLNVIAVPAVTRPGGRRSCSLAPGIKNNFPLLRETIKACTNIDRCLAAL